MLVKLNLMSLGGRQCRRNRFRGLDQDIFLGLFLVLAEQKVIEINNIYTSNFFLYTHLKPIA